MLIKLNGVSMAELESALKYSGLFVETRDGHEDYAEIKAIPAFLIKDRPLQEGRALESLEVWEKLGESYGEGK
jgi:hypothetical protein